VTPAAGPLRMAIRRGLEQGLLVASAAFFETRFPPYDALRFWQFWRKCRGAWRPAVRLRPEVASAVAHFRRHRFGVYRDEQTAGSAREIKRVLGPWFDERSAGSYLLVYDGEPGDLPGVRELFAGRLRDLVETLLGSNFSIFYGVAHRSVAQSKPPESGYTSSLWHADGSPPSCLTVMLYLDDTDEENGAIEFGPRGLSRRVLVKSVSRWRSLGQVELVDRFRREMERHESRHVAAAPAGSVVVFSNNLLHRGGLAQGARSRDVLIFHLYPALHPFQPGARTMRKTAGVPSRPDF
jgi:phytanoyl-CoA dioxygenase PhyH